MKPDELFLTAILECKRSDLYLDPPTLTDDQQKLFEEMKQRYMAGEPLQYIIGYTEFFGHKIFVDDRVLIPRPETEGLVELALLSSRGAERRGDPKVEQSGLLCYARNDELNILELGTGSGCISIALAKSLKSAKITAIDLSADALNVTQKNIDFHGLKNIDLIQADMQDFLNESDEKYDLIISNPPYIVKKDLESLPDDVKQEPISALDGGKDGLDFYRSIFEHGWGILSDDGMIICEIGEDQQEDLKNLVEKIGRYKEIEFYKDLVGKDRYIKVSI